MARQVKCFYTKEIGTNETFYKAKDGHYYKDEDTYKKYLEEKNKPKPKTVTCFYTKEKGLDVEFFLAPDGHWYKSEDIYNHKVQQGELFRKITDKLADWLGYFDGQKFPTVVMKKLKDLDVYGREIIYKTMEKVDDSVKYALNNREFSSDNGRCAYVMAIIQNSINDVYNDYLLSKKRQVTENRIQKSQELENVDMSNIGVKKQSKDVSYLLGDDDLWT